MEVRRDRDRAGGERRGVGEVGVLLAGAGEGLRARTSWSPCARGRWRRRSGRRRRRPPAGTARVQWPGSRRSRTASWRRAPSSRPSRGHAGDGSVASWGSPVCVGVGPEQPNRTVGKTDRPSRCVSAGQPLPTAAGRCKISARGRTRRLDPLRAHRRRRRAADDPPGLAQGLRPRRDRRARDPRPHHRRHRLRPGAGRCGLHRAAAPPLRPRGSAVQQPATWRGSFRSCA